MKKIKNVLPRCIDIKFFKTEVEIVQPETIQFLNEICLLYV